MLLRNARGFTSQRPVHSGVVFAATCARFGPGFGRSSRPFILWQLQQPSASISLRPWSSFGAFGWPASWRWQRKQPASTAFIGYIGRSLNLSIPQSYAFIQRPVCVSSISSRSASSSTGIPFSSRPVWSSSWSFS